MKDIVQFKRCLMNRAAQTGLAFDFDASDAAAGNDKLHAAIVMTDNKRIVTGRMHCMNHQTNLIHVVFVVSVFYSSLVSSMATISGLVGMGTHSVRCMLMVTTFLRRPCLG